MVSIGEKMVSVMRFRYCASFVSALLFLTSASAMAKRVPSKPVAPVESNGIRYAADGNGSDQYVAATEIPTGKQLWRVRVFHTHIKFWYDPCVQIVFITELRLVEGSL